jgi:membrane protease subunit (stomatin/prohibitin family)
MIFNKIRNQLRSVIEWENPTAEYLFYLWSENNDEIKNASKLLIKPGQGVILLYEGKVQAIHNEEGLYEISSSNIPFITTLNKFMQAFESEHKVGIYYYWKTQFLDQKWGTVAPIKYTDPVYNFPVGLRARGNFTFQITKPDYFFIEIVGSKPVFPISDARTVIVSRLQSPLADLLAESGLSFAEIDRNREEISRDLVVKISPEFDTLGLKMNDFRIEATEFDQETMQRINRITDLSAEAIAAQKAGLNYAQLQQLEALRDAAKNEGGVAGLGVGIGAGLGLGNIFNQGLAGINQPTDSTNTKVVSTTDRLKKLKSLLEEGLISEDEYKAKRESILGEL